MKKVLLSLITLTTLSTQCLSLKDIIRSVSIRSQDTMTPTCFPKPITYSQDEAIVIKKELLKEQLQKVQDAVVKRDAALKNRDNILETQTLTDESRESLDRACKLIEAEATSIGATLLTISQLPANEVAEKFAAQSYVFPETKASLKRYQEEKQNEETIRNILLLSM